MVFMAAFAWRVSMQTAGRPAMLSSSCSQAVSEQASRPIRSSGKPIDVRVAASGCGSLTARASLMIRPVSSTTQMVVSSR
jgi:hypothetical protein